MADHIASDQVSEGPSDKNVRGKMLARSHAACADGQGERVGRQLHPLARILQCKDPRKGKSYSCMAGWERPVWLVGTRTVGPESSAAVAFVGALAIRCELQRFYDKQRVDDRFFFQ